MVVGAGASAGASTTAQAQIMAQYVGAVGRVPLMPEWAAGYWHSPMGRPDFTQTEAMDAMNGFKPRGIPLPSIYIM